MRLLSLLFALILAVPVFAAEPASPTENLVLILDASGSMWGKLGNRTKIEAARSVVRDLVGQLPAQAKLGLVAYGHRQKSECSDIEVLVPAGSADKTALADKVDKLNPLGMTPITRAFEQAAASAAGAGKPGTIVLVTDGLETCGGDPCGAVRRARQAGQKFIFHVVGFDVAKENVSSLECAAQAGGGLYLPAANADELYAALLTTTADKSPVGDAVLAIKSVVDGKLHDATVQVLDGAGKQVAAGRTYATAQTNPRRLPVPAGTYDVIVTPMGMQGSAKLRFEDLEVASGGTLEKTADFSSGEISVKVTRNGALSDATVVVYEPGTRKQIAGGRSYKASNSNPKIFRLPPGQYDVAVNSVEIASRASHAFSKVTVTAGQRVELDQPFSSGTLQVGATQGGALIDATVTIRNSNAEQVAGGRLYPDAKNNPKSFELEPGEYTVSVAPVKLPGTQSKKVVVKVESGSNSTNTVEFTQ